jgi:ring-1,2-phenylacetyl-CoA epoxidase subunit PaaD
MVNAIMATSETAALADAPRVAAEREPLPTLSALWRALETVPDPEIPVLSVVELGIVRSIEWNGSEPATLVVRVTPTYSGCPATEVIMAGIRDAITGAGVARVRLETQLAPSWTTEWITPEARRKLARFGIAPPSGHAANHPRRAMVPIDISGLSPLRSVAEIVPCPRCGSERTRVLSRFGSTACKAQYRCDTCLEPFDYLKPH